MYVCMNHLVNWNIISEIFMCFCEALYYIFHRKEGVYKLQLINQLINQLILLNSVQQTLSWAQ